MQKTWAAAESAFHILGWQGWNVLASLWLCDPSPSMLGTRNNQIFHKSLKRHGKQLAAIWQPQTNKSQNLVAAKNNSNKNKADYYDRAVITARCGWVNCCKFIISWPSITTTTTVSVVQFTHWSETLSYRAGAVYSGDKHVHLEWEEPYRIKQVISSNTDLP